MATVSTWVPPRKAESPSGPESRGKSVSGSLPTAMSPADEAAGKWDELGETLPSVVGIADVGVAVAVFVVAVAVFVVAVTVEVNSN